MKRTTVTITAALLVLFLAALASPVGAEQRRPPSAVVIRLPEIPQDGLVESGMVPTAGVVVGTLMIVGGLWSPKRVRR